MNSTLFSTEYFPAEALLNPISSRWAETARRGACKSTTYSTKYYSTRVSTAVSSANVVLLRVCTGHFE